MTLAEGRSSVWKRVSLILIVVAAVSGTLVSARACFGPFFFLEQINWPLNLQSIFGLSATLAFLCRMKEGDASGNTLIRAGWSDTASLATIILVGLVEFWQTLSYSFLSDDFYLVTLAASTREYSAALFKHGGGAEFFRPVGGLALALTAWWAGTDVFSWHLASLLLHLANSVLVVPADTAFVFEPASSSDRVHPIHYPRNTAGGGHLGLGTL